MIHRVLPFALFLALNGRQRRLLGPSGAALSLTLAAVYVQGCGSHDCEPMTMRCNGNRAELCVDQGCGERITGCSFSWISEDTCGGGSNPPVCVVANPDQKSDVSSLHPAAFCAQSSDVDPNCDGTLGYCTADTAVTCRDGFAVESVPCAPPQTCSNGKCTDQRCAERSLRDLFCDGATIRECAEGAHSVVSEVCPVTCVAKSFSVFCALSDQPDPRCPSTDSISKCDGTGPHSMISCIEGFVSERFECTDCGGTCAGW